MMGNPLRILTEWRLTATIVHVNLNTAISKESSWRNLSALLKKKESESAQHFIKSTPYRRNNRLQHCRASHNASIPLVPFHYLLLHRCIGHHTMLAFPWSLSITYCSIGVVTKLLTKNTYQPNMITWLSLQALLLIPRIPGFSMQQQHLIHEQQQHAAS